MSAGAALRGLQEWCRRQTDGYPGVTITNMTSSFRDGLAFCAIIHHHRPDLIDFRSLKTENVLQNNQLAFTVAERDLGIPALLDAEDMVAMRVPDRLSVITYVSQYYNYFNGRAPIGGATKRPPGPAEAEPSTKKPVLSASADKENVFKGIAAGAQRHSPTCARRGGSLASIGEGSPAAATPHSPPTFNVAKAPAAAQGSTCTMCGLRVRLVERHLVDGRLYHHNCFRCKECSNTLMSGTYKAGKEPGTYVCQHHRARSIITTTAATAASSATTTITAGTTAGTTATTTPSSTSFLLSRLMSPSTAHDVTPGRDVPSIGKSSSAVGTSPVSHPTPLSGREGSTAASPRPSTLHLAVSPSPQNNRTGEARSTFFQSTPASGQTTPGWDRLEPQSLGGGGSVTPTAGSTGTPASLVLDKNRNEEREKTLENARQLLAKHLPYRPSASVVPASNNNLSPTSGKRSPTSGKRSPTSGKRSPTSEKVSSISGKLSPTSGKHSTASGNLSPISRETPTVTPAASTPTPLPRRTIAESTPSRWASSVSPVPKYTPSATPEKPPSLGTRFSTSATGAGVVGSNGIGNSTGASRTPAASLGDSSVKAPSSIYAGLVLRKTETPGQPAGFPAKSPTSESGAGKFGVILRPTKLPTPFPRTGTTSTTSSTSSYTTTPTTTKATTPASGTTTHSTTTFFPESNKTHSVTVTVTVPDPEQPRPVVGGGNRSTAQWEVPLSPSGTGHRGSALFGHGDTKGRGGSPSRTPETPKKTFGKKSPAPGYGYPSRRTPRCKPDTYMAPEKIQEELNTICRSLDELQQRGVLLEEELRSCEGGDGEDELLINWFRLIQDKNMLVRRESELAYICKQQILEENHADVENQLRRIMVRPEGVMSEKEKALEQELLDKLVQIVHDRNVIVESLERDRLREMEEDKALEDMLNTKDIFKTQETKETGQETPKDIGNETPKETLKETPKEKKERKKAEEEKRNLEKKEKLRAEKEQREIEKQAKLQAEKDQKEKEKQQKQAEKERKEKEKREKEKQEKEKREKEKLEKQEKSKKSKEKTENTKNKGDRLPSETENGKIEA